MKLHNESNPDERAQMKIFANMPCQTLATKVSILLSLFLGYAASTWAVEPLLEVVNGAQVQQFNTATLLANPAVRTIEITDDVSYHKTMQYQAVPLIALLPQAGKSETLQFTALDGFVANIPGKLFAGKAQAWLAIEPADQHWPALKTSDPASAGPFYLVWVKPEAGGVSSEQWPYQIARIAEALPLQVRHPQIVPRSPAGSPAQRGLQVFVTNCAVCHRINGGGDAAVGPDLNLPFNPTEYLQETYLRKLIRNPASVRTWQGSVMPGFSAQQVSDTDLGDLLTYLKQMAKQRK